MHQKTDWAQLGDVAAPGSRSLIIARDKPGSPEEPGSPTSPNHSAMLENWLRREENSAQVSATRCVCWEEVLPRKQHQRETSPWGEEPRDKATGTLNWGWGEGGRIRRLFLFPFERWHCDRRGPDPAWLLYLCALGNLSLPLSVFFPRAQDGELVARNRTSDNRLDSIDGCHHGGSHISLQLS